MSSDTTALKNPNLDFAYNRNANMSSTTTLVRETRCDMDVVVVHQAQQAATAGMVKDQMSSQGLTISDELAQHASDISHEDFPCRVGSELLCAPPALSAPPPTPVLPSPRSAAERLFPFVPPANYGAVLPGSIYRSGYPVKDNFDFLKNLKIKTILTLVPEPISKEYQDFMQSQGIKHFQVHIPANKLQVSTEPRSMEAALRCVLDRANHPMLIHCNKGKHRTGCTTACLRRMLGVAPDEVREEYHSYAGAKARFYDEVFFEEFNLGPLELMASQQGWAPKMPKIGYFEPPRVKTPPGFGFKSI